MPGKRKLSYQITEADVYALVEDVETLLDVQVEFRLEYRLQPDGRAQGLWLTVCLAERGLPVGVRSARTKLRRLPPHDVDLVQVSWDLLWDMVKERQDSFL